LEDFIDWISKNTEWVFSGAGIAIIGLIGRFVFKGMQTSSSQKIKSGSSSTNLQIGRDINIGSGSNNDDVQEK